MKINKKISRIFIIPLVILFMASAAVFAGSNGVNPEKGAIKDDDSYALELSREFKKNKDEILELKISAESWSEVRNILEKQNAQKELSQERVLELYNKGYRILDIEKAHELSLTYEKSSEEILLIKGKADFRIEENSIEIKKEMKNESEITIQDYSKPWYEVVADLELSKSMKAKGLSDDKIKQEEKNISEARKNSKKADKNELLQIKNELEQNLKNNDNITDEKTLTIQTLSADNSSVYNNYIYPKAAYKEGIEPPYSIKNEFQENIDPASGNLDIKVTDLSLKGKNGLDLNLTRCYSLSNANIGESSVSRAYGTKYGFDISTSIYRKYTVPHDFDGDGYLDGDRIDLIYPTMSTNLYNTLAEAESARAQCTSPEGAFIAIISDPMTDIFGEYRIYQVIVPYPIRTINGEFYFDSTKSLTTSEKYFNLGAGWTFDLPYIEIKDDYKYLRCGSAGSWTIDFGFEGGTSHLVDYTLKDMTLNKDYSYSNGEVISNYVLVEKDGKETYFGSDGRLLGIKDRFGNEIKFLHTLVPMTEKDSRLGTSVTKDYPLISKIIDSVGREININYTVAQVTITVEDKTEPQNNRTITYHKTLISDTEYKLDYVLDTENRKTTYDYSVKNANFSLTSKDSNTGIANTYICLTQITYPTLGQTRYTYTVAVKNCGSEGFMKFYKCDSRAEYKKDGSRYNYVQYSYKYGNTIEHDGYPSSQAIISESNPVLTQIKDVSGNSQIYKYSYISNPSTWKGQLLCINILNEGVDSKNETINEYDPVSKLPVKVINRVYKPGSTTQFIESVENYTYNDYRDITGYWDKQAQRNTGRMPLNDENKIAFTYNDRYHYVTNKVYKRDVNHTITEEYIPSGDHRTITLYKIKENNVLKKKVAYQYDIYGNIIEEIHYLNDGTSDWNTNKNSTYYDYTDYQASQLRNLSGVYLTRKYVANIKDANGTLVASKPGNFPGMVDELYRYDWFGNVVEKEDGEGNITSFEYDKLGRVKKQINDDDTFKVYTYVSNGSENSVKVTDENQNTAGFTSYGNQSKSIFDELGNLIYEQIYNTATGQLVNIQQYSYDTSSRLDWEKNLSNNTLIDYTYYHDGRLKKTEIKDKNSVLLSSESYIYEDADTTNTYATITKTTQGDTNSPSIKSCTYLNKLGQIVKHEKYHNTAIYTETMKYDYLGNTIEALSAQDAIEGRTFTTKTEYNFAGKPVKSTNNSNKYATTTYDESGRIIATTDYKGNGANFYYDGMGRLIKEEHPFVTGNNAMKKHYYDLNGNIIKEETKSSLPGSADKYDILEYQFNSRNQLVKVIATEKDNKKNYTQYYYDPTGNKIRMYTGLAAPIDIYGLDDIAPTDDTEFSVTKYEYNPQGQITKMTDPLGNSETYSYNINGILESKTDRNGNLSEFEYDGLNRVKTQKVTCPEPEMNVTHTFSYTLTGQKKTMDGTTYIYDDLGRLKRETQADGIIKDYGYNANNSRTSLIIKKDGVTQTNTSYTYDSLNRLYQVKEGGIVSATYSYDVNGNRESITYSNGNTTVYEYNFANKLKTLTNKKGTTNLSQYTYTYYLDGNQATKAETNTNKTTTYVYDGMGRMELETETGSPAVTYTYDDYSNRATKAIGTEVTSYTYDKNNRLTSESKVAGDVSEVTTYLYDNNGNQIYKGLETVKPVVTGENEVFSTFILGEGTTAGVQISQYDGFNRLTKVIYDDTTAEYAYNGDGLRISKTVNGIVTRHIWDGDQIALEISGLGTVTNKYVRGINLIYAENISGTKQYYLFNGHGDVVQLTSSTGDVVKTYEYDAFGNEKIPDINDTNVFRYCSEYFDKETGTIYLRARYYDPMIGKFITEDSVWGKDKDPLSLNLYTYCHNDPIQYNDPSGHVIDIIADIFFIGWDVVDIIMDPTNPVNWTALGADVACTVVPFATGGGRAVKLTAKGIEAANKAINGLSKAEKISTFGSGKVTMSYKALKAIMKGTGLEVHHLIEKRFADTLGVKADDIFSIAIDKTTHNKMTQMFREKIGYNVVDIFKNDVRTGNATPQQIWDAAKEIYTKLGMEKYLEPLKQQLIEAGVKKGYKINFGE